MKMTAAQKNERVKAHIMSGPIGFWIRIGQEIGYGKTLILLAGLTDFTRPYQASTAVPKPNYQTGA